MLPFAIRNLLARKERTALLALGVLIVSAAFGLLLTSPNYALQLSAVTRATTAGGLPPDPNATPWFQGAFFQFPILLAAIEPAQEEALVGLKTALHSGNYLTPPACAYGNLTVRCEIPLILNTHSYILFTLAASWERINLPFDELTLGRVQAKRTC